MIRVTDARLLHDFTVWVRFNDGTEGEIDLSDELEGPVFEPLQDPETFAQVHVDPDIHTLVWPNGADFAPDFLYQNVRIPA